MWLDVAKGIAMVAIVMGHFDIGFIDRIVYPWHVPLFFVIAGFFLSRSVPAREFVGKKAKVLLLPFAFTAVAVVLTLTVKALCCGGDVLDAFLRSLASAVYGSGSAKGATTFGADNIGAVWFLEAMFWAVLLVRFTNIWIVGALAMVSWLSARYVWLPLNLQSGALSALFVYSGQYIYRKTELLRATSWPFFTLGVASFLGTVAINPPIFFVKNVCSPLSIVLAVFIVYFLLTAFRWISEICFVRVVGSAVGTNTLSILCLHSFQLKCFSLDSLWVMTPCANWSGGRLPFYILFLLVCNAVYFGIGILVINSVKVLKGKLIRKGTI